MNFDLVEIDKELASRSFAAFARMAWHVLEPATPIKWGWALDAICEHLEAVHSGQIHHLAMAVPPGMMKSLLTSVLYPAWVWGPKKTPQHRFLSTAHKQDLAVRDNLKCRRLIQSKWYQDRWPVELTGDQNAKTKFENVNTGFREAMAFTSMTGSRGDCVILDDPISADGANSQAAIEAARLSFLEALPTRINNEDSAIVVIMQRLHANDTIGIIEQKDLPYTKLILPMRFELDTRCSTAIGFTDPRTKEGELLFPERFSERQVTLLEKTLGSHAAAGQLQQRPAPRGGGIFKAEWWKYYTALPAIQWRSIYVDTAQKTADHNDYTVFECWGRGVDGKAYLIDLLRGKWEAPELLTQSRAFWNKHKSVQGLGSLRAMNIEDKVSGTGAIQTLKREGIPVIAVQRDRDKISRAYDITPLAESGQIVLPANAPWLSALLEELSLFPVGAHDDQVDPFIDGVVDVCGVKSGSYNWDAFA